LKVEGSSHDFSHMTFLTAKASQRTHPRSKRMTRPHSERVHRVRRHFEFSVLNTAFGREGLRLSKTLN
jgi:hypothetical protein